MALAAAFSLIFLDVKPKSKWFSVSTFLMSHPYDTILVFLGQSEKSETTPFCTIRMREPYVKRLLLGRAIWVTFLVLLGTVAPTMMSWAVPGHRLWTGF